MLALQVLLLRLTVAVFLKIRFFYDLISHVGDLEFWGAGGKMGFLGKPGQDGRC
jgi:hypothetical protein